MDENHFCYLCGNKAIYQFKNGKWCCSSNVAKCPVIKNKRKINNNLGQYALNGHKSWNKGKNKNNDERIKKYSETYKEKYKNGKISKKNISEETRLKQAQNAVNNIKNIKNKILTNPEKIFIDILKNNNIGIGFPDFITKEYSFISDQKVDVYFQYPIQRYLCDFVWLTKMIIIRIQGDYWHCNPIIYKDPSKFSKSQINNLKHDKNASEYFLKNGWSVIDIWESELLYKKDYVNDLVNNIKKSDSYFYIDKINDDDWDCFLQKKFLTKKNNIIKKDYYCSNCGKKIKKNKTNKCFKCSRFCKRKVSRPSKEILEKEIQENSFVALGKKYGVSDNAIRKWCKSYNIL